MNIDQFWNIVERVHRSAPNDMEAKCLLLESELHPLPDEELISFGEQFGACFFRAYTWDVWGAACVICDGCGDDSFMDFRSTLISLGRIPFEAALTDADSLAEFEIDPQWASFEGYQYVPNRAFENRGIELAERHSPHPSEPSGIPFNQWEMTARFPKLVAKYGYKDSDWLFEKERREKDERDRQVGQRLAALMLASGIIPENGLIPPPQIVRAVLRTGRSPNPESSVCWTPFEMDEGHFWHAVQTLEDPSRKRPNRLDLSGTVDFKLDVGASDVTTYEEWVRSLRTRGLF